MAEFKWNLQKSERLINFVSAHRKLYDLNYADQKSYEIRNKLWDQIAVEMNTTG